MRPYRIVDETFDEDEEYPRVVPIGTGGRGWAGGLSRHQPWTPREADAPVAPRRHEPPPLMTESSLSRTHRWMIAGFIIVCVGMVLGMTLVRVWDEASRAVAALPPEGAESTTRQAAAAPPSQSAAPADQQTAAPGAGGISTDIQVLQPNYTVAPGDTLGIIAHKHGTSVDALASINNLENRNSLRVGQKLIIP
jgi:LysM domain